MRVIEGNYHVTGRQVLIAVSRFNSLVTEPLLAGALDALARHGIAPDQVTVLKVPGAWELPAVLQRASRARTADGAPRFQGLIALGAVIRGESVHFDYVCAEVSKGVASVGMEAPMPVIFGVLTCNHLQEALERAGGKAGNKGYDAGVACVEMMSLQDELDGAWGPGVAREAP